jgi:hypothetical protein
MYGKNREKNEKNSGDSNSNHVPHEQVKGTFTTKLHIDLCWFHAFISFVPIFSFGQRSRVSHPLHENSAKSPHLKRFEPETSCISSTTLDHQTTCWFMIVLWKGSTYHFPSKKQNLKASHGRHAGPVRRPSSRTPRPRWLIAYENNSCKKLGGTGYSNPRHGERRRMYYH